MSGCGGVDALLSYTRSACCEINVAERGPMIHAWPCCGAKPILLYSVIFLISTGPVCTGPTCEPWKTAAEYYEFQALNTPGTRHTIKVLEKCSRGPPRGFPEEVEQI